MGFESRTARTVAVLGVLTLVVAAAGVGALLLDRPRVTGVENEWGTTTAERTEVRTRIAVDNPRVVELTDATLDAEYAVSVNGIEVADERVESVALSGPQDVVTTSTRFDNSEIPRLWASHVNNGENTTVTVDPTVETAIAGVDLGASSFTWNRTVQTDLLDSLNVDRTREIQALGATVLYVNETRAEWGTATVERTPVELSATVTNPLPVGLPIANLSYTVRLNDIVVGSGQTGTRTVVPPGSTETIPATAAIDNQKLDEWWVSHRRNDGTSELTVEFNATVSVGGRDVRVPLPALTYDRTVSTDILDGLAANGSRSVATGSISRVAAPGGSAGTADSRARYRQT
jgi:LEA14-like dessication related protein